MTFSPIQAILCQIGVGTYNEIPTILMTNSVGNWNLTFCPVIIIAIGTIAHQIHPKACKRNDKMNLWWYLIHFCTPHPQKWCAAYSHFVATHTCTVSLTFLSTYLHGQKGCLHLSKAAGLVTLYFIFGHWKNYHCPPWFNTGFSEVEFTTLKPEMLLCNWVWEPQREKFAFWVQKSESSLATLVH